MADRLRRGRQVRGPRRQTAWGGFDVGGYTSVASGGATILSGVSFEDPGTIVRLRGLISVKLQAYGADLDVTGALPPCPG